MDENKKYQWIRNPLSMYGLFLSFCYSVTSIVVGVNLQYLFSPCERLPLIWFIVGFPTLLLIVVTLLVIFCPPKLYGPSDYKDEGIFLRLMTEKERERKNEIEVAEIVAETKKESENSYISKENASTLYKQVETYAIKQVSKDFNISLMQNVNISRDNKIYCDALGINNGVFYFVEIKYFKNLNIAPSLILNIKNQILKIISSYSGENSIFILAIVYDNYSQSSESRIRNSFEEINNSIKVVFYKRP